MSEKFPQRFFVPRKEDMQEVIHVYDIFKHYPGDIEYLSLQEHNHLLSQLEERLRETEIKHQHIIMASKQVFKWFTPTDPEHPVGKLRTAVEELAAIKEQA